jgi:RNA polymerase sigma factor (sigma-70 family)
MSARLKKRSMDLLARFVPHANKLRRYLARRCCDPHAVDDLAQEVYLRLLRRDDAAVNDPIRYLYGVAANVLAEFHLDEALERKRVTTDSDELARIADQREEFSVLGAGEQLVERQQLERMLHRLPENQAKVLVLHELEGLSYIEVSETLKLTLNTVEKYLVLAKIQLRSLLYPSQHGQDRRR